MVLIFFEFLDFHFKVIKGTTEHKKWLKIGKNCTKSFFLLKGKM